VSIASGIDAIGFSPVVKVDGDTITLYTQGRFTQGALILMGLLRGGDYDQGGLPGFGMAIAAGLAPSGLGDLLLTAAQTLSPPQLDDYLVVWRSMLRQELATNASGGLGRTYAKLSGAIPDDFPNPVVLLRYTSPLTTWSNGHEPDLPDLQPRHPDIPRLVTICRRRFTWGTRDGIQIKFSNILWDAVCAHLLRKVRCPSLTICIHLNISHISHRTHSVFMHSNSINRPSSPFIGLERKPTPCFIESNTRLRDCPVL
jgi:hypothetical protein